MWSVLMKVSILSILISEILCANILYLHGVLSPSHHLWNSILATELANRGHNVTFLSVDKPRKDTKNLHYVVIEKAYENIKFNDSEDEGDFLNYADRINSNRLKSAKILAEFSLMVCNSIVISDGLDKILDYPNDFHFDAVIYDFTAGPCLIPVVHKFNYPPIIGVSAFLNPSYTNNLIGGNKYPSYVPFYLALFPQIMNFYQRFYNHLLYWIEQ